MSKDSYWVYCNEICNCKIPCQKTTLQGECMMYYNIFLRFKKKILLYLTGKIEWSATSWLCSVQHTVSDRAQRLVTWQGDIRPWRYQKTSNGKLVSPFRKPAFGYLEQVRFRDKSIESCEKTTKRYVTHRICVWIEEGIGLDESRHVFPVNLHL